MIRTLLLAALVAVALCQSPNVVDQAEWFGPPGRLGMGPFCDSGCSPSGYWTLRRDWRDLESEMSKVFIYFADGDIPYWHGDSDNAQRISCGLLVNDFILSGNSILEATVEFRADLLSCKPEIMYMFEFMVSYSHKKGQLMHKLFLKGSYTNITDAAWGAFVDDYYSPTIQDKRTEPWSLIRLFPSLVGARGTSNYDNDVYLQQWYIANYEKNFCTFTGSNVPVEEIAHCHFPDDYDSEDFGTNFVSRDFCQWMIGDYGTHVLKNDNCPSPLVDSCDQLRVTDDDDDTTRRRNIGERDHASKFRNLMTAVQKGAKPVEVPREHVEKQLRDQYNPGTQPIPQFPVNNPVGNPYTWAQEWADAVFYYVPYGSSITAPYCAYQYDS